MALASLARGKISGKGQSFGRTLVIVIRYAVWYLLVVLVVVVMEVVVVVVGVGLKVTSYSAT